MTDRLEGLEQARRAGHRLGVDAFHFVDVTNALLPIDRAPWREAPAPKVDVGEIQSDDLASSTSAIASEQNGRMHTRVNVARRVDQALIGVVVVEVGLSLV